jgi:hypothetical protein
VCGGSSHFEQNLSVAGLLHQVILFVFIEGVWDESSLL